MRMSRLCKILLGHIRRIPEPKATCVRSTIQGLVCTYDKLLPVACEGLVAFIHRGSLGALKCYQPGSAEADADLMCDQALEVIQKAYNQCEIDKCVLDGFKVLFNQHQGVDIAALQQAEGSSSNTALQLVKQLPMQTMREMFRVVLDYADTVLNLYSGEHSNVLGPQGKKMIKSATEYVYSITDTKSFDEEKILAAMNDYKDACVDQRAMPANVEAAAAKPLGEAPDAATLASLAEATLPGDVTCYMEGLLKGLSEMNVSELNDLQTAAEAALQSFEQALSQMGGLCINL